MRFNLISNLCNGSGLQCDFEVLSTELQALGHTVHGIQFNTHSHVAPAEVNLFLETVVPSVFSYAPQQWVIPNPEWWLPPYHAALPHLTKILCKTHDGVKLFRQIAGERVSYLGFRSKDLYQPTVPRELRFLHVAGNSLLKNTDTLLEAWRQIDYPLSIVTKLRPLAARAREVANVTVHERLSDADFSHAMNAAQFHICPSKYEGFGHYLHEAQGVGAVIITGDAAPMNEFGTPPELLVPSRPGQQMRLATLQEMKPSHLVRSVEQAMALQDKIPAWSASARTRFVQEQDAFRRNLQTLVGTA